MSYLIPLFLALLGWSESLSIDVPAPDFKIEDSRNIIAGRNLTLALPPGALLKSVRFQGTRKALGRFDLPPAPPVIPLSGGTALIKAIEAQKNLRPPAELGRLLSKGGLRKYTLIQVACYHYAYEPAYGTLLQAERIRIEIDYAMPDPDSERLRTQQRLMNDITFDDRARKLIYNWQEAQPWYPVTRASVANGYTIILPTALQTTIAPLVTYRENQGYDVSIVTKEYIETNGTGLDLQEKIRNYLRANLAEIEFVLLVGFSTDLPWRSLVPFNNDPNSPYDSPDYSPIPGDIYYAELTDPDTLSWDSDQDGLYGEVYNASFQPFGNDDPDFFPDIHLGRIPFSTPSVVADIIAKTIAFDSNRDYAYKTAALLAGSIYYFENENDAGGARLDGADFTEAIMDEGVLDRNNCDYLYETAGLNPSLHPCIDALNQANMKAYWQRKGVMYECHHGSTHTYARKVWATDDGDGVPESNEIQWPTCLMSNDVYQLDNDYPATTFLRSCLCGKPETTGLGAMLLYRGASSVISSSRVAWMSGTDTGGIPQHFYYRLLRDLPASQGVVGVAHDLAKIDFMNACGFWLPIYHYNLFGDPALRQFGRRFSLQPRQPMKTPVLHSF